MSYVQQLAEKAAGSTWRTPGNLAAIFRRFSGRFPSMGHTPAIARAPMLQQASHVLGLGAEAVKNWDEPLLGRTPYAAKHVAGKLNALISKLPGRPLDNERLLASQWSRSAPQNSGRLSRLLQMIGLRKPEQLGPAELFRGLKTTGQDAFNGIRGLGGSVARDHVHTSPIQSVASTYGIMSPSGTLAATYKPTAGQRYYPDFGLEDAFRDISKDLGGTAAEIFQNKVRPRPGVPFPEASPLNRFYETLAGKGKNPFTGYTFLNESTRHDVPIGSKLEKMLRSALSPIAPYYRGGVVQLAEKAAISMEMVMRAAQNASHRGATPARLEQFGQTIAKWVPKAITRSTNLASTATGISRELVPSKWFPKFVPKLVDGVERAVRGKVPTNGVLPRLLSNRPVSKPSESMFTAGSKISPNIKSSPHWEVLLHEAGHAVDHLNGSFAGPVFENERITKLWRNELAANRKFTDVARRLQAEGIPGVPGFKQLRHYGNRVQLDNYRKGLVAYALPGPNDPDGETYAALAENGLLPKIPKWLERFRKLVVPSQVPQLAKAAARSVKTATAYSDYVRKLVSSGMTDKAVTFLRRLGAVNAPSGKTLLSGSRYSDAATGASGWDVNKALAEIRKYIKNPVPSRPPARAPKLSPADLADKIPFWHGTTEWAANRLKSNPSGAMGALDGYEVANKQRSGAFRVYQGLMAHIPENGIGGLTRSTGFYPSRAVGGAHSAAVAPHAERMATLFGEIPRKVLQRASNYYENSIPWNHMRFATNLRVLPAGESSPALSEGVRLLGTLAKAAAKSVGVSSGTHKPGSSQARLLMSSLASNRQSAWRYGTRMTKKPVEGTPDAERGPGPRTGADATPTA